MTALPDLSEFIVATTSGLVFRAPVDRLPPDEDEEEEASGAAAAAAAARGDSPHAAAAAGSAESGDSAGKKSTVPNLVATAISDAPIGAVLAIQPLA